MADVLHSVLTGAELHEPKGHATNHESGGTDELMINDLNTDDNISLGGYDIIDIGDIEIASGQFMYIKSQDATNAVSIDDNYLFSFREIRPSPDNTHALGVTTAKWSHVWATTLHGALAYSELTGVPDYVLADGTVPMTGDLDLGSFDIDNVEDITATRMYGDVVFEIPASNLHSNGLTIYRYNGNAGAVAVGDVCYMAADGHLEFGDADAATTAPAMYMALGSTGAAALGYWMVQGVVRNDTWNWTVGPGEAGLIFLSCTGTTGNTLTQTRPSGSGDQVQVIGHALSADVIMFDPSPVLVEVS